MIATDPTSVSREDFVNNLAVILDFIFENASNYYCFSDMMQTALAMQETPEAKGLSFVTLQSIYDQYMSTLSQMAYIRCSGAKTKDEGYHYASPSVNLFAMNKEGYFAPDCRSLFTKNLYYGGMVVDKAALEKFVDQVMNAETAEESFDMIYRCFGGTWYAANVNLETVERRYTSSEFHKMTGWGNVLKTLPSNPIYMINPLRIEKNGMLEDE